MTTIPTYTSIEGRLTTDPHLSHADDGRVFTRVRLDAEPRPRYQGDAFEYAAPVECTLLMFGKGAESLARRFRFGDVVVASGRVSEKDPATFVARRIGHDAARTTYTVTRTAARGAAAHARRRRATNRAVPRPTA